MPSATAKKYYTFMIDPPLLAALKAAAAARPELSEAGVIREALRDWFSKHHVPIAKTASRRVAARRHT